MKITNPTFWKATGLLATMLIRNWMELIDFKAAFHDPAVDPAFGRKDQRFILLFWHEHILCPLFLRRNSSVTMMLSQHGDAEIVNQVARLAGMKCVRGSSFRGGATVAKQFLELQSENIIAITPDGPRGPRRTMAAGPIFLASKLQLPIVLVGVGYDRLWRMKSWDRFAVPKPFSRGRFIVSPKLTIPGDLDKDGLEFHRKRMETLLTQLTDEAEDWAVSGVPLLGESIICSGPKCSLMYYGYDKAAVAESEPGTE